MNFLKIFLSVTFMFSFSYAKDLVNLHEALRKDLLQSILAKELCTCIFVTDLGPKDAPLDYKKELCLKRSNLPVPKGILLTLVDINAENKEVTIELTTVGSAASFFSGGTAKAHFEGSRIGCRLL